jgi:hypothetical protein
MLAVVMCGATSQILFGRMPVAIDSVPSETPDWMSV